MNPMKTTATLLALAATTAVLAACGSAPAAPAPAAPVGAAPVAAAQPSGSTAAPAATSTMAPTGSRPAPVEDPGAEVDGDDQSGDGTTVVVRDARITVGPGWLAIRTDDDDSGRLLGSAALQPGQTGPVTVTLTEPVPADDDDDDLSVVLHADDGDGVFDERLDPRILDSEDDDSDDDDLEDDDLEYRVN